MTLTLLHIEQHQGWGYGPLWVVVGAPDVHWWLEDTFPGMSWAWSPKFRGWLVPDHFVGGLVQYASIYGVTVIVQPVRDNEAS